MKKRKIILLVAILGFVVLPMTAKAYWDGPHLPEGFDSDACSSCHVTNPHHSPPVNSWPSKLDELCQGCHYDGSPVVRAEWTKQKTHSSRTTSTTYGNWEVDCWECHNPHGQEQDDQWGTTYGKYIRTYSQRCSSFSGTCYNFHLVKYIDPVTCTTDPWILFCPPYPDDTVVENRIDLTGPQIEFTNQNQFVDGVAGVGDGAEYDDICQACHTQTTNYNRVSALDSHTDYGADSQPGGNCTGCHSHENGFKASAGHGDDDQKVLESTNCTTAGCHDGTITGTWTPIPDIHGDNCNLCHVSASGGGPLWEPWETNNTNGGVCEDCHNGGVAAGTIDARAAIHHNFKYSDKTSQGGPAASDGSAVQGLCVTCHLPDVGQSGVDNLRINLDIPANAACGFCHIYWGGGEGATNQVQTTDSKVRVYANTWDPNGTTANLPMEQTELTSHTISENTTLPISDFAACFACHGADTSKGGGFQVTPFHGFGDTYTGDATCDGGGPCGGIASNIINIYGAPTVTGTGNKSWPTEGHTESRHPGFNAIGILSTIMQLPAGKQDSVYGGSSNANYFSADDQEHDQSGDYVILVSGDNVDIPWDIYDGASTATAPGTVTITTEYNQVLGDDSGQNHTVNTTMPTFTFP